MYLFFFFILNKRYESCRLQALRRKVKFWRGHGVGRLVLYESASPSPPPPPPSSRSGGHTRQVKVDAADGRYVTFLDARPIAPGTRAPVSRPGVVFHPFRPAENAFHTAPADTCAPKHGVRKNRFEVDTLRRTLRNTRGGVRRLVRMRFLVVFWIDRLIIVRVIKSSKQTCLCVVCRTCRLIEEKRDRKLQRDCFFFFYL